MIPQIIRNIQWALIIESGARVAQQRIRFSVIFANSDMQTTIYSILFFNITSIYFCLSSL